jgi:hypothetical protein
MLLSLVLFANVTNDVFSTGLNCAVESPITRNLLKSEAVSSTFATALARSVTLTNFTSGLLTGVPGLLPLSTAIGR